MQVPGEQTIADARITEGPLVRGMLVFGLPLVLATTCHGVFNLVDAWFVGQMADGSASLAAIAIADPVLMFATIFANGVSTATVAMVARARGRGDHERVRRLSGQGLILVGLLSLAFGVLGVVLAEPIGLAMGARGEVLELVTSYLRLMFAGVFTMIVLLQLTSVLRAVGSSAGPVTVLVAANVVNIAADPFLIDPEGILGITGLPKFGLMGAGYATIGARFLGCLLALWLCMRATPKLFPMRGEWKPDRETIRTMVRIGAPNSVQLIIRVLAMLFLVGLVGQAFSAGGNPDVVAAMGIGIRIDMVVLFAAMGWGAAAATYAGQNMGTGNHSRAAKATWTGVGAATLMMLVAGAAIWWWAEDVVRFMAPDSAGLVAYGTKYLRLMAPSYPLAAGAVVLALALNGAGSTKAPAVIDSVAYILLVCPAALIAVVWLGNDHRAVWGAVAAGNVILAVMYGLWFARGSWRTIRL